MQAMIFAAGLGTRLKPLTDTMPKALVRVGGAPLLEHVVRRLTDAGCSRMVVNVHHFANQITAHNYGMDIYVSDETEQLLDTGGGIKRAASLFDQHQPVLIHNVDILSNVDFPEPDGPTIATNSPLFIVKSKPSKACTMFSPAL